MSKYWLLVTLFLLACSPHKAIVYVADGADGIDGTSCSVSNYELEYSESLESQVLGALISCTDGSSALVLNGSSGADGLNGADGLDGLDGLDGVAGSSCSVSREANADHATVTCGDASVTLYDGANGSDGSDGADGQDGADGSGVTVTTIAVSSSCTAVGSSASAKKDGSSGNIKLYNTTNCSSSSFNMEDGDSAFTPAGELVVKVQNSSTLKLVSFN